MAAMALLTVLILGTCPAFSSQEYSRQEVVENSNLCLDCHDDMKATLDNTVHEIIDENYLNASIDVGCISCHDGWQEHLDDPSAETISRVSDKGMTDQAEVCSRCHITVHQSAMVTSDVHSRAELACTSCHSIHDNQHDKLVLDDEGNYCLTCHTEVKADFKMRSSHPLNSGNIRCVSCHPVTGIAGPHMTAGLNWTCQNCHDDKAGPFPFEHPVTFDHLVEGGGCVECHNPHGSSNDRLLKQPESGLCLQCHGIPPLHRTQHSGLGIKMACVDCHSEIHGSYDNSKLLDPMLGTKLFPDCYQSGCHDGVR
jgi:DmsE family decaheme c-type cytochrome